MKLLDFVFASLGSTAIIGIMVYLFRSALKRGIEKSIDYSYDKRLETYKADLKQVNDLELKNIENQLTYKLESAKLYLSQYSQKQFGLYNDLWLSLVELKYSIEKLWTERANIPNLKVLVKKHSMAKRERLKNAILLEPRHYEELGLLLDVIEQFQVGKERIIDLRRENERYNRINEDDIDQIVIENGELKTQFDDFLVQFRISIQLQIKGVPDDKNED